MPAGNSRGVANAGSTRADQLTQAWSLLSDPKVQTDHDSPQPQHHNSELAAPNARGTVAVDVNVIFSNEPDPAAEADIDRLLASMLKVKRCE